MDKKVIGDFPRQGLTRSLVGVNVWHGWKICSFCKDSSQTDIGKLQFWQTENNDILNAGLQKTICQKDMTDSNEGKAPENYLSDSYDR